MVLEARSWLINPDLLIEENNELDEQQVLDMCREIYFAKHAKESSAQNYRLFSEYDFKLWLKPKINDLVNFIHPDVDQEKIKSKITRWLSQKLPPKI